MDEIVISDTSCLIVLTNSNQLDLLHLLFERIYITKEIAKEYSLPLPEWIEIHTTNSFAAINLLENQLDIGEASAINLALSHPGCTLLIDEKKGRNVAQSLGIHIMGTVRLLIIARQRNLISSLEQALESIQLVGFRLSPKLVREVLDKYAD